MTTHITKTWFDGEKVVTQEIPEADIYLPLPVAYSYTSKITGAQGFSHHPLPRFTDVEHWDIVPLYAAPPQRKPLTDDEIDQIIVQELGIEPDIEADDDCMVLFARAIEAAHGIKGGA